MVFSTRHTAAFLLGMGLLWGGSDVLAQTITPQLPVVQTPAPPTPVTPPIPVTPSTPVPLQEGVPYCKQLNLTIPAGNHVEIVECQLSIGTVCLVSVAAGGDVSTSCTGMFIETPTSSPPVPVPLPTTPTPPAATN